MKIDILHKTIELSGVLVGMWIFIIIIFARWLCIWGEYHFTKKFWIIFLVFGLWAVILSLFIKNIILSTIFSSFGFIFLWGINETIEQQKRVEKGWFPKKKNKMTNE